MANDLLFTLPIPGHLSKGGAYDNEVVPLLKGEWVYIIYKNSVAAKILHATCGICPTFESQHNTAD